MAYLGDIYSKMGVALDPSDEYFDTDSRFMALERILRSLPAGKMCDLGCGRGALIRRLGNHHECYGTDYDSGAVQHCQSAGLRVQEIDLNEATALPFPISAFDVIVISEVCEHLLNPRNALQLAKNHLKSGGALVVTVPNAVPLFARLMLLFGSSVDWLHYPSEATETTGHIRFYTIESMSRLLQQEGFIVEKRYGVSFRMNGVLWERLCYWIPRALRWRGKSAPTNLDSWLGQAMPGFSPGLMFVCAKSAR